MMKNQNVKSVIYEYIWENEELNSPEKVVSAFLQLDNNKLSEYLISKKENVVFELGKYPFITEHTPFYCSMFTTMTAANKFVTETILFVCENESLNIYYTCNSPTIKDIKTPLHELLKKIPDEIGCFKKIGKSEQFVESGSNDEIVLKKKIIGKYLDVPSMCFSAKEILTRYYSILSFANSFNSQKPYNPKRVFVSSKDLIYNLGWNMGEVEVIYDKKSTTEVILNGFYELGDIEAVENNYGDVKKALDFSIIVE